MNFLNPIFLAALSAVAVPLLIHLFSRRRVREIPFSTLMFLQRSDRRSMKRVNLRRTLLLILRMAVIALLVLAFARPVMRGGVAALFPAGGSREAGILIDRSYSMGVRDERGMVFERAGKKAMEILNSLEDEDAIKLITFSSGTRLRYTGRNLNMTVLERELESMTSSFRSTDVTLSVREALQLLAGSRRPVKELYVISDFQRSGLDQVKEEGEEEPPVRLYLVPVQPGQGGNVSVRGVFTPRVVLHRGEVAAVTVELKNNSPAFKDRFPLRILLDGKRVIEQEMELLPGEMKRETFYIPVEREGWLEGEVSKGRDRLPADDSRFFVLHAREKVRTLLVSGREGMYLKRALDPAGGEGDISVKTVNWEDITSRDLEDAEVLVLGPGGGPLAGDREIFMDFVKEGGRMVIFVLPGLKNFVEQISGNNPEVEFRKLNRGFVSAQKPVKDVPLLSPFSDKDMEEFLRIKIVEYPLVTGIRESDVLIRFNDDFPMMWEEEVGDGYIRFISIIPTPEAGRMVLSPYFLPLVHQSVVTPGGKPGRREGVLVGEKLLLRGTGRGDLACILPDGSEVKPEKGAVGEQDPGRAEDITAPGESGVESQGDDYTVDAGEVPGYLAVMEDGELKRKIAVNPDCTRESDLDTAEPEEVADSLGIDQFVTIGEDQPAGEMIREARGGKEVSGILVMAALILFAGELFLSQRRITGVAD